MGTVHDLIEAARQLTHAERMQLIRELEALDAEVWDKQIAADVEAGKLDFLLTQALEAENKGQLRDL